MEPIKYQQLKKFLVELTFEKEITTKEKATIKRIAKQYFEKDGLIYRRNKDIPQRLIEDFEKEAIIFAMHSDAFAGHFSFEETLRRTQQRYFWPQMGSDIRDFTKACDTCQRRGKPKTTQPLHPIQVGQPFNMVGMDIVGPLPETKRGNKYIIVATEYLTKWPEAKALPNAKAASVVPFFYEDIICRHGCPKTLLTDQGTHFVNELLDSLCEYLGVKHKLSSAYHPQTNGLTERFNRTMCETLAKYVSAFKTDWDIHLPSMLFAYRTKMQSTTKQEPFYLMYGRKATLPIQTQIDTYPNEETTDENFQAHLLKRIYNLIEDLPAVHKQVRQTIEKSQEKQKARHDVKIISHEYSIGDKVLLFRNQLTTKGHQRNKLAERWDGPFYIHTAAENGTFKLRTMEGQVKKRIVHANRIKPYLERSLEPIVVIESVPLQSI